MPILKRDLLTITETDIPRLAKSGEELLSQKFAQSAELYNRILHSSRDDLASDELIEHVYDMLIAFGMNSQKAKMSELLDFTKLIQKHADTIQSLAKLKLEEIEENDNAFKTTIDSLFSALEGITQTISTLGTFSKTMHFLLPDLFIPISRKNTLQFYYADMPFNRERKMQHVIDSGEKQRECLEQVFDDFRQFAQKRYEILKAQVDKTSCWNRNIPKVIDNILIAYVSEKME